MSLTPIVIGVVCLVLGGGLVLIYGKLKGKLGENKTDKREEATRRANEARAKEIESQPPITNADDVADALDGMRKP